MVKVKNVIFGLLFSIVYLFVAYCFFVGANAGVQWNSATTGLNTTVTVLASRAVISYMVPTFFIIFIKVIEIFFPSQKVEE